MGKYDRPFLPKVRSPSFCQSTIALIFPKVRSPRFSPSTIALISPALRSP
ncbi:hypothetical protein QT971_02100 [Microcoleus sp. herbarium19]